MGVIRNFLIACALLVSVCARAANPSFADFNVNQFSTTGNKVAISSGVLITNMITTGIRMTNRFASPGFLYIFDPTTGLVDQIIPGTGISVAGGLLSWDFPSGNGGTNNNAFTFGGLGVSAPIKSSVTYTTGSNYVFNLAGNRVQYLTLNNNATITFTNIPTDTNYQSEAWLVVTNSNGYIVNFSDPVFAWSTGNNPATSSNSVMRFKVTYLKGLLWGDVEGPASPMVPDIDTISGTLVRDPGNRPLWSDGSQGFLWSEQYVQNEALNVGRNFINAVGGTGAIGNGSSATNLYGALQLQAPAVNDHSAVRSSTTIYLGDGVWWYETRLAIERVPTGAQDSRIMAGITTYKAGAWFGTTNGAWWQGSSTNTDWRMMTATNGVVSNTGSGTNLVINQPIWLGVLTSNLNSTAYFYIGPTKQIMKTNRVGTLTGVGMGNLAFGHAAGIHVTKVNGSGTDNRVDVYSQDLFQRPITAY